LAHTIQSCGSWGYDDWFLPTQYEFSELRDELTTINNAITSNGGDAINLSNSYWTSFNVSATEAKIYNFNTGSQSTQPKTNQYYVRAVRSFY